MPNNITLTQHFIHNWERRVGGYPSLPLVRKILREAKCIQTGRLMKSLRGPEIVSTLSIYWHIDLNLIIKFDNYQSRAVTVLSADMNDWRSH